ncbi:MAG: DUF4870 domain-containing protein [Pseudomonadota bacterium]
MTDPNDPGTGPETSATPASESAATPEPAAADPALEKRTNQWAMFIHFSMLAGWIVPLAGLIVPIILWQIKKDELPGIQPHAYVVLNWIITSLVYGVICFILTFIAIGVLGFLALAVVTVIYAIVGGVKANDGEVWEYPGTIIKVFKS